MAIKTVAMTERDKGRVALALPVSFKAVKLTRSRRARPRYPRRDLPSWTNP